MSLFESLGLEFKRRNLSMMKIFICLKLKLCSFMFGYFEEVKRN